MIECHYCPEQSPDLTTAIRHFEAKHRDNGYKEISVSGLVVLAGNPDYAKTTDAKMERNLEIIRLANKGMKAPQIADKLKMGQRQVQRVIKEAKDATLNGEGMTSWQLFSKFLEDICNPQGCPIWDSCKGTSPTLCEYWVDYKKRKRSGEIGEYPIGVDIPCMKEKKDK